jgi:oligoendopeptidase F
MQYPSGYEAFLQLSPVDVQALADELIQRPLSSETVDQWLVDWAELVVLFQESLARLDIAVSVNTADQASAERVQTFRETIWPIDHKMSPQMTARLFEHRSILTPALVALMDEIKRQDRLNQSDEAIALLKERYELADEYGGLLGAQSIEWQGQTLADRQARSLFNHPDAQVREDVWHLLMARRSQDYQAIAEIWTKILALHQKLARANGFENYLDYLWQEMDRRDYTLNESRTMHQAMRESWSPLYGQLMAKKQQALGLAKISPWDIEASTHGEPLKPFSSSEELLSKTSRLFHRLAPTFGANFDHLAEIGLIDIAVRENTAPVGGFARAVGKTGVFVMLNCQGRRVDVENLIHEMGHAFAIMETVKLPYHFHWGFSFDFTETPSSVMEMLSMPYWDEFYEDASLAQARHEYFEDMVRYSLNDVMSEAFQFWVYSHLEEARDPANCDAKWLELHQQYLPNVDWQHNAVAQSWQRAIPFFIPFVPSMEYVYGRIAGLNLLREIEQNQPSAAARYQKAIGMGLSAPTHELFSVLGTRFFFKPEDVANAAKQLEGYLNA